MVDISELLARRSDISTFLVHLTRRTDREHSAESNLKSILKGGVIQARAAFGPAASKVKGRDLDSQRCVSFSETPLEHIYYLTQAVPTRSIRLSSFGLVFSKMVLRRRGVNPVWYVDITPGHEWLMNPINKLIAYAVTHRKKVRDSAIAQIAPFIDQMGSGRGRSGYGYKKEFWWEREWRHKGNFRFFRSEVILGLAPQRNVEKFEKYTEKLGRKIRFVDPKWSLERIIAHLCDCQDALSPFDAD